MVALSSQDGTKGSSAENLPGGGDELNGQSGIIVLVGMAGRLGGVVGIETTSVDVAGGVAFPLRLPMETPEQAESNNIKPIIDPRARRWTSQQRFFFVIMNIS